jgi:hypothetical protein
VTTIAESLIVRLTDVLTVCGCEDESVAVTEMVYVPAVTGVPDNCPEGSNPKPGGKLPDSVQLIGGVPPDARNA